MIFSSSSGDHLDCFLAGDSAGWVPCCLLVGTQAAAGMGVDWAVVDATAMVGTDAERDDSGIEVVDRASSSSSGLRSSEISTLSEYERYQTGELWGLRSTQSMCAASETPSTSYTRRAPATVPEQWYEEINRAEKRPWWNKRWVTKKPPETQDEGQQVEGAGNEL